jgi:hypothetical protein
LETGNLDWGCSRRRLDVAREHHLQNWDAQSEVHPVSSFLIV